MKFDQLKDFSIPKMEDDILKFWEDNKIFEKSLEAAKDKPHFVFYEGPPTANGRPGIHHVITRTIKDLICRYKSMKGFRVDRKAGWDTHGLPVEHEVEKQLKLETKAQVIEYGIEKFNQKCKESVFQYIDDWNEITRRIGYWINFDDAYITLTPDYVETVWWILKNLFDRNLIYKGFKTVPYCPRCETPLSSHEVAQGYVEVADPSVFIRVKDKEEDFFYVVWTTTPWTLPSNAALCMLADADYAIVEFEGEKLCMAEALLSKVLGTEYKLIEKRKGSEFVNRKYEPIFDTFKDKENKAFYVINGDFVTLEDGTGIVHIAPGYGADDYEIGQEHGLPVLQAVSADGHFVAGSGKYEGQYIKAADPVIIKDLREAGKLYKTEKYVHNYPFCWRCDSPLIYIARQCWYIRTTEFKEQLLKNSNITHWYPDEIRTGRMRDWLENNIDWALSRERFWGTPLPIWVCDDESCGHMTAVGSVEQLHKDGFDVPDDLDLHKPKIDEVKLRCEKCNGKMTRVPEVIDTWFDSGSMPYAQWHYPFENKQEFELKYPAEFISEGVDQTRGWFYTLLAISTMLFDKPAFKNVIVIEMILDKNGKKMSKSKGNVVDPFEIVYKYGADPTRWYMLINSNPWLATKFSENTLAEGIRKLFDTLKNCYSFFALYTNVDNIADRAIDEKKTVEQFLAQFAGESERTDRWVVSKYNTLVKKVGERLENYDLTPAARMISDFVINDLSNWYIRLNRRRFWAGGDDPSKMRAFLTLYRTLTGLCKLIAPYTPFISEYLWRELTAPDNNSDKASVHMETYPVSDENAIDSELEESMSLAQGIVSLGRAARSRKNLKVRQPLSGILVNIPGINQFEKIGPETQTIMDELNIKSIKELKDVSSVAGYKAKLNFAKAGPRLGAAVKAIATRIASLSDDEIKAFLKDNEIKLSINDSDYVLSEREIEVEKLEKDGFAVESGGGITVALLTEIDDTLRNEGFAREMVNKVQNMRKSSDFEVTDRIKVWVSTDEPLTAAIEKYKDFICKETLADDIEMVSSMPEGNEAKNWNINGVKADIAVIKKIDGS
jgi:isoleucyl-tRNA synthetase